MSDNRPKQQATSIIILIIALIASFIVWSAFAEVDEIARGNGKVIPATRTQVIQSSEPGVVKEIGVQIGQIVKKGDLIIRLDDTNSAADLGQVEAKVRALKARVGRLTLEAAGDLGVNFTCPTEVATSAPAICENENNLLDARRQAYSNTVSVLEQRLVQREKELQEVNANIDRLEGSLKIATRELGLLTPMAKRKLIAETELIRAQRDVNDFNGQLNAAKESVKRLDGAVQEAKLQVQEVALQFRQEALTQKTDALAELSVLEESARGESTKVARTDIRSPVDGIVNTMMINTIGSFVQPGAVISEIVPTSEKLLIEARISPKDIAFVRAGQRALVKITAYDFSIYGGLDGEVVNVSPDSILDTKTGEPYFEVRVKTGRSVLKKENTVFEITPGMVCGVDIMTGRKSILSYLMKPINKAREEALRER